jgi:hypothetical protein
MSVKVLWLSRHALSAEQLADFARESGHELNMLAVSTANMTFPAKSWEAVRHINEVATQGDFDVVCGVFPAHIAARFAAEQVGGKEGSYSVWVPVSVPKFAEDGTSRGFEHSHWERIDLEG